LEKKPASFPHTHPPTPFFGTLDGGVPGLKKRLLAGSLLLAWVDPPGGVVCVRLKKCPGPNRRAIIPPESHGGGAWGARLRGLRGGEEEHELVGAGDQELVRPRGLLLPPAVVPGAAHAAARRAGDPRMRTEARMDDGGGTRGW